ncbi:hypothetical protein BGT96224_A21183 [Blumeria graminis f. sp. tritici 96224]|uniref:Uncharacterized protein n=1 Tax=Blumeria graminis f. sp. tritici 96224 TaxID=1268274 RepID=A0A656KQB6_BLUGR|nr:hypothetical protein BGT96224_A21183 [Blumeria graminis f. sp. tritici 96224]
MAHPLGLSCVSCECFLVYVKSMHDHLRTILHTQCSKTGPIQVDLQRLWYLYTVEGVWASVCLPKFDPSLYFKVSLFKFLFLISR